jgi:hypothetical protein
VPTGKIATARRCEADRNMNDQQSKLVDALVSTVRRFTPDWTASSPSDPGVTLLELFSSLADSVLFRQEKLSDPERAALMRLRDKLAALSHDCYADSGLTRPRYFSGRLLTASDFQEEQDYTRETMWRHNLCLHDPGIVKGLRVTLDADAPAGGGFAIVVSPGCAIDYTGRELCLCEPLRCTLRVRSTSGYVVLRYAEHHIDPVPSLEDGRPAEPSHIKEGVALDFTENLPIDGVALARLIRSGRQWRLGRKFHPAKITPRR